MRQPGKNYVAGVKILVAVAFVTVLLTGCNKQTVNSTGVGGCSAVTEYKLMPPDRSPQVALIGQEQDQWCWAATGQMILGYFGETISQCKEVSDRFPALGDCCNGPEKCSQQTGWPEFCKHNVDVKIRHTNGLKWDEITSQIHCQQNPIAFAWRWADGIRGHMMVLFGYGSSGPNPSDNFVWIRNPLPKGKGKTEKVSYSDYMATTDSNSGQPIHTHWDDFYDFQKKQNVACTNVNSE